MASGLTTCAAGGADTLTFTFDSEHQRIKQVGPSDTTRYVNAGGVLSELVTASSGAVTWRSYFMVDGRMIGVNDPTGSGAAWGSANWGTLSWTSTASTMLYYHDDSLGSIMALTNGSGTVHERDAYDAWGKRRSPTGADDTNDMLPASATTRGYTDQEQLIDVALIHMNGRVYDPQIGKFTSADPKTNRLYSTQGWNRYAYVDDNPLNATDPTGYDATPQNSCAALGCNLPTTTAALHPGSPEFEQFMLEHDPGYGGVIAGTVPGQTAQSNSAGNTVQTDASGNQTYSATTTGNPATPSSKSTDEIGSGGGQKTVEEAVTTAAAGGGGFNDGVYHSGSDDSGIQQVADKEIKHSAPDDFRNYYEKTYGPEIVKQSESHNTCSTCAMSVLSIESKWGTSRGAREENNLAGYDDSHPPDAQHATTWQTIHHFATWEDSVTAFFTKTYAGRRLSGATDLGTFLGRMEDQAPRYNANVQEYKDAVTNRYNEIKNDLQK